MLDFKCFKWSLTQRLKVTVQSVDFENLMEERELLLQ